MNYLEDTLSEKNREIYALPDNPLPERYTDKSLPDYPELRDRVRKATSYLNPNHRRFIIEKVYPFANFWHRNQKRKTGGPYLEHPVAVLEILATLYTPVWMLAAGLLHDTYEDNLDLLNTSEIEMLFGPYIRSLVENVTNISLASGKHRRFIAENPDLQAPKSWGSINVSNELSKLAKIRDKYASQAKLLTGLAHDPCILLIKIADRLHNMRTLESKNGINGVVGVRRDKQKRIAKETAKFYCPIATRFGLWDIKTELEDLCFYYIYSHTYQSMETMCIYTRARFHEYLQAEKEKIEKKLYDSYIDAEVTIEDNPLYTIMYSLKTREFFKRKIHSVNFIRIVVANDEICKMVQREIYSLYDTFECRDYITNPKMNGYQGIHIYLNVTKINIFKRYVLGSNTIKVYPFDLIQIYSREGLRNSKIGVFSIFQELVSKDSKFDIPGYLKEKCAPWLSSLSDKRQVTEDDMDFMDIILRESLVDKISCFSKRTGESYNLPLGSTILDLAAAMDLEDGKFLYRCRGAVLRGQNISIDYNLKDNDFIDILISDDATPTRGWYDMCQTSDAQKLLSQWYQKNYSRNANIGFGKKILEHYLELSDAGSLDDEVLQEIATNCKCKDFDDMLFQLGVRSLSLNVFKEKLDYVILSHFPSVKNKKEEIDDVHS
ncbi:HD domain-containing protein [bacterium]|nr:HD domain-containing protein [bacterium]